MYVRSFPGPGGKWPISVGAAATIAVWSRTGQEVYYRTAEGIVAVSYSVHGEEFVPGKPRLLAVRKGITSFDVAPDGKRMAATVREESERDPARPAQATFLLNFFDELRRRAPPGNTK